MPRSRQLENFLPVDIDEAATYYAKEARAMQGSKRVNALHFLRYFPAYKEYQETNALPPIGDKPEVTIQCFYRVEQMLMNYINLRHKGRL
jgi:hypothetical protein